MKNLIVILTLFPAIVKSQSGVFSFTLTGSARTSAGVFKKDSTLVRTLWADRTYQAGTYTEYWDGKDDYGKSISSPDANYNIKVLSNNVNYTWEGIIGNTSLSNTGTGVHRGYYTSMTGMAIAGNTAYFCQGYSEAYSSQAKFSTAAPQVRLDLSGFGGKLSSMTADYVVTDGSNVYWAGYDAYVTANSFVMATKVSDDSQVSFGTNGSAYTMQKIGAPKKYTSVIDKLNIARSKPTGLAVQQSGNYLFVAHGALNQLHVLNKKTGALVQNLTYTNVSGLATDGTYLWVVTGSNVVSKYTVNSNGTLSSAILKLSGISTAGAISVKGTTIAVIDGGANQIVRFFNTSTGTQTSTLGTAGGYTTSPDVTNTKFLFNDFRGNTNSFLTFASDGSFWVGDPGNYRELHYTSGRSFIETIQSLGASYSTCADPNNITRVFANYLEFAIDYTKPLTGSTGWKLVKNWGFKTQSPSSNIRKLLNVVTLSNGRTYGQDYGGLGFVELTSTGLRSTGLINTGVLNKDGSVTKFTGSYNTGSSVVLTRYSLTGFDAKNNPKWSTTGTLLAATPPNTMKDPNNFPGNVSPTSYNFISLSDKVIFYNPSLYYGGTATLYDGYHLGAIKKGGNKWLWKTQKANTKGYKGSFPKADYFEVGNGVNQYAGNNVNVVDNNIITGYHGEFWKNGQTNYFNHYYEDGLAVGQFGTDFYKITADLNFYPAPSIGNAGNTLSPTVVKDAKGDLYLYHGDESYHGGMHRWKITNISSIKEQTVSIAFPKSYATPASDHINLHSGLPLNLVPATAGWKTSGTLTSITGTKKYILDGAPDILTSFVQLTGTAAVQKDLGTNNVATSWKISGQVSYEFSDVVVGSGIMSYVDVLDGSGKILARFYYSGNPTTKVVTIYGNNKIIASATGLSTTVLQFQPLEINIINGVVTFKYANFPAVTTSIYDKAGNWKQPKTLRQYFTGGFPAYRKYIGFMDMLFYKDYSLTNPSTLYVKNIFRKRM